MYHVLRDNLLRLENYVGGSVPLLMLPTVGLLMWCYNPDHEGLRLLFIRLVDNGTGPALKFTVRRRRLLYPMVSQTGGGMMHARLYSMQRDHTDAGGVASNVFVDPGGAFQHQVSYVRIPVTNSGDPLAFVRGDKWFITVVGARDNFQQFPPRVVDVTQRIDDRVIGFNGGRTTVTVNTNWMELSGQTFLQSMSVPTRHHLMADFFRFMLAGELPHLGGGAAPLVNENMVLFSVTPDDEDE